MASLFDARGPLFLTNLSLPGLGNTAAISETQLLYVINTAQTSLSCSFRDVNLPSVHEALHLAFLRGVQVRVGLDDDNKNGIGFRMLAQYLTSSGFYRNLWTGNAGAGQVYMNMCVADKIHTWISTAPPTYQGLYSAAHFTAEIRSPEEGIARKFSMEADLFTHGTFGSAKQRLNQRNYWFHNGINIGVYFSPEEDPLEGFLIQRIRGTKSSVQIYSSEFFSNQLDSTTKLRTAKDLAYEIVSVGAQYKQVLGSVYSDCTADPDSNAGTGYNECTNSSSGKLNSMNYLRGNGVQAPVFAGDWPENGLNFVIMENGAAGPQVYVTSHPFSTKADSSHDGFLLALDDPSQVANFAGFFNTMLTRSFSSANFTADAVPAANGREVVISEINWMGAYKSDLSSSGYEYVELYNTQTRPMNISGWRLSCHVTGGSFSTIFTVPNGTLIGPGQYMVFTYDSTSVIPSIIHGKTSTWGGSNKINDTTTDQCRLDDAVNTTVDTAGVQGITFASNSEVFGSNDTTNKLRRSMERSDLGTAGDNTSNWHTSTSASWASNYNIATTYLDRTFGSPGVPNSAAGARTFNVIAASGTAATTVLVTFSEAPDGAASSAGSYTIGVGSCASTLAVSGAAVSGSIVTLTTAAQTGGTTYTVCVSGVKAASGGATLNISSSTFFGFANVCTSPNVLITEFHAAPSTSVQDPNYDGSADSGQDEFIELKNVGGTACNLSGYVLADSSSVRHTFPTGSVLAPGQRYVVFGGGATPVIPGALVDVASTGAFSLNNTGPEAVKFCNSATGCASTSCTAAAPELDCACYPVAGACTLANPTSAKSYARGGGETGAFVLHDTLSAPEYFSPGTAPGSARPFVYQFAASKTSPRSGATPAPSTNIKVHFSTGMTSGSLTNTNIKLYKDAIDTCNANEMVLNNATVSTSSITNDTVAFVPASQLDDNSVYCVRVTTGVQSAAGVPVSPAADILYSFTTGDSSGGSGGSSTIVISEVSTQDSGGSGTLPAGSQREYIELYNSGSTDININGWKILRKTSSGTFSSFITITTDSCADFSYGLYASPCVVPANGFFLLTSGPTAGGYIPANGNAGDFVGFTQAIANTNNGLQLQDSTGAIVDALCYGSHTDTTDCEGTQATDPGATQALERKARASSSVADMMLAGADYLLGNAYDTNVNSTDFVVITTKNPQNRYGGGTEIPPAADITPPVFGGITSAGNPSSSTIDLQWTAATDDVSAQANITYLVCRSTTSGACNTTFTTTYSVTGGTGTVTYVATGLSASTQYYFVVRAKDQSNNTSTNTQESSATTSAPPAFNVSSSASTANTTITVTFNGAPTAGTGATGSENTANYCISLSAEADCSGPDLTVSGAVLAGSVVTLTTSAQVGASGYRVYVSNVTRASDSATLNTSSATFTGTGVTLYNFTNWTAGAGVCPGGCPASMTFRCTQTLDNTLAATVAGSYTGATNIAATSFGVRGETASGISLLNTGTANAICNYGAGNGYMAAIDVAVNTTGRTTIRVSWSAAQISDQTREWALRLQYSSDGGTNFSDVAGPVEFDSAAVGTSTAFSNFGPTTLPVACENNANCIVRFRYYNTSGSSGSRTRIAIDEILVTGN